MMKGKISFIQMMTKKLFRIRMKPRPGEERVEQSVVQSEECQASAQHCKEQEC